MFTGIVEGMGRVTEVQREEELVRMGIALPAALTDIAVGDSICINGACLTVVERGERSFRVDVSPETLARTTLSSLKPNDEVNLERALRLSDRLGGHLVTGHVDGTGYIAEVMAGGDARVITLRVDQQVLQYLVEKGSVTVEGVSLTISRMRGDGFQVTIIPYTAHNTNLGAKRPGDRVNIEVDIIGKYVKRFLQEADGEGEGIDLNFLAKHGFVPREE